MSTRQLVFLIKGQVKCKFYITRRLGILETLQMKSSIVISILVIRFWHRKQGKQ